MKKAVILFAHGARDPEWATPIHAVCAKLKVEAPDVLVEVAFLEFMSPSLAEAVGHLVAQLVTSVVVVPMFIAQGGHLKHDLPKEIEALRAAYPSVLITQAETVGLNEHVQAAMAAHAINTVRSSDR